MRTCAGTAWGPGTKRGRTARFWSVRFSDVSFGHTRPNCQILGWLPGPGLFMILQRLKNSFVVCNCGPQTAADRHFLFTTLLLPHYLLLPLMWQGTDSLSQRYLKAWGFLFLFRSVTSSLQVDILSPCCMISNLIVTGEHGAK
jgi:hypothetical protein